MQKSGRIILRKEEKTSLLVKYPAFEYRLSFGVSTNIDIRLNTLNYNIFPNSQVEITIILLHVCYN